MTRRRPSSSPKAVIFDLDDTIINTNRRRAWHRTLSEFERRLPAHDVMDVAAAIADAADAFWADPENNKRWGLSIPEGRRFLVEGVLANLGVRDAGLPGDLMTEFSKGRDDDLVLFAGVRETLEQMSADGIRLAMLTNGSSEMQRRKISRFELSAQFEHIQVQEEFGTGKPDPAAFRNVLEVLDLQVDEVWMVGDHLELDVAAAQNLGIFAIWHDHKGSGLPSGNRIQPDHIVTAIPELLSLAGLGS